LQGTRDIASIAMGDESVATGEVRAVAMEGKRALHREGAELHCEEQEILQHCVAMEREGVAPEDESVATGEVRCVAMGKRALHREGELSCIARNEKRCNAALHRRTRVLQWERCVALQWRAREHCTGRES